MNCYIIDDEQPAINIMIRHIEKIPSLKLLRSSTSSLQGLWALKKLPAIDILFLDMDMPDLNGLELIELLPAGTGVVFSTAHTVYAVNAFEVNAIDFLLKPVPFTKFLKVVEKAEAQYKLKETNLKPTQTSIFINPGIRGRVVQIHFSDILYIEGLKNNIVIYTTGGGRQITYLSMNDFSAALSEQQFCRLHKSYIVNLHKIQSIEGNRIILTENITIPLGNTYKESFMKIISGFTIKSLRSTEQKGHYS